MEMVFPDSPIRLPNGKLACHGHGQQICYECCVDYSFVDSDTDKTTSDEADTEDDYTEARSALEPPTNVLICAAAAFVPDTEGPATTEFCPECDVSWLCPLSNPSSTIEQVKKKLRVHDPLKHSKPRR